MKTHAIFIGITGALLLSTLASSALAQARIYPDGSDCNDLIGGALVACQNQVYANQLESGISQQVEPTTVPSSNVEGTDAEKPDFVPGAEGTPPPDALNTGAGIPMSAPSAYYSLPGPEGTQRIYGPTE